MSDNENKDLNCEEGDLNSEEVEGEAEKGTPPEEEDFKCEDCSADTIEIHEYYMVHDAVWNAVVPAAQKHIFLCVGCLETRLGRRLVPDDFPDVPLNYFKDKSLRLTNRLGPWFREFDGPYRDPRAISKAMQAIGLRFEGRVVRMPRPKQ